MLCYRGSTVVKGQCCLLMIFTLTSYRFSLTAIYVHTLDNFTFVEAYIVLCYRGSTVVKGLCGLLMVFKLTSYRF